MKLLFTNNAYVCMEEILLTEDIHYTKQHKQYLRRIYNVMDKLVSGELDGNLRPELGRNQYSYRVQDHVVYFLKDQESIIITGVFHYALDPTQARKIRHNTPIGESGSLFAESDHWG